MSTVWQQVEVRGIFEIPGLPGVRVEALPVFKDARGSLHELFRVDEIPAGFKPLMACSSWSHPGVARGPHQHVGQDDYFTFAGPSDFRVYLWDDRPGAAGAAKGWIINTGERPRRASTSRAALFTLITMSATFSDSSSPSPACCLKARAGASRWMKSVTN